VNYFRKERIVRLKLIRDVTKHIKRGNPWVFSDAIEKAKGEDGSYAILTNHKKEVIGHGIFASNINLTFRVLTIGDKRFTAQDVESRIDNAINNKIHLLTDENQCFRVLNGEGDDLPGVVADYYQGVLVLKFDGEACENFWNREALAEYLFNHSTLKVSCVYYKRKNKYEDKGEVLKGSHPNLTQVQFLEHGALFETNIIDAAKTGFFLDQRENRRFIQDISKGKTLLNLFGYTGGFSIFAGLGGSSKVTTVDIAPHAILASQKNWELNKLNPDLHEAICEDAFSWVKSAIENKKLYDIVITDPPSFAPNQKAVENAREAYIKIFADSIRLVKNQGHFVASSCSGHIGLEAFIEIVTEALSRARRRGKVLLIKGQPEDHPYPLALQEMRYLKFVYLQIFKD